MAALGWDEVRFPNPVRVGDRLSLEVTFVDKKLSASKPDRGIVHTRITVSNQDGIPVLTQKDTILVARKKG